MFAAPLLMKPGNALSNAAGVEAFLSGSKGHVFDFTDASKMWQENTKTNQVTTPGQNIGYIDSKYGSTLYSMSEASLVGFWTGDAWEGNGVDQRLLNVAASDMLNAAPAACLFARVRFDTITSQPVILAYSTPMGTIQRFVVDVLNTGVIRILSRRLDTDGLTTVQSAAGVIAGGNTYTIRAQRNFETGAMDIWVNGTNVATTVVGGATGLVSATNSTRVRMSLALSNTLSQRLDGAITRIIVAPKIPTSEEAAYCTGYVEEFVP